MADPETLAEYDASADEFSMARELIAARSRAGLTQGEVAARMGTTQSVVARLESGKRTPSMRSVQRYAQAVGARAVVHLESVVSQKDWSQPVHRTERRVSPVRLQGHSSQGFAGVQSVQTFDRQHAEDILKPTGAGAYIMVNEDGLWPGVPYDPDLSVETELLRWRPAKALNDPTIDLSKTPLLPFPFTVRQLAAFFHDGIGSVVAEFYGGVVDGPDLESLREIDPDSMARTAIAQAFEAYREAKHAVNDTPGGSTDDDALVRRLLDVSLEAIKPADRPPDQTIAIGSMVTADVHEPALAAARRIEHRDLLTPHIETAQRDLADPLDTPAVWAKLLDFAVEKRRPMIGKTDGGIQWLDENDDLQMLTLKKLRDRLHRQKKRAKKFSSDAPSRTASGSAG